MQGAFGCGDRPAVRCANEDETAAPFQRYCPRGQGVPNGIQVMREPRVHTAKKTMLYLATSLAITAAGILLCYLLLGVHAEKG